MIGQILYSLLKGRESRGSRGGVKGREQNVAVSTHFHKDGAFILGRSKIRDFARRRLAHRGKEHLVTIGRTRANKGTSLIIPNVLEHPGSQFVVDPKGEAAVICARKLEEKGHRVVILDPFGVVAKMNGGRPMGYECGFNPIADIDPNDLHAPKEINELAAILIQDQSKNDGSYWQDITRMVVAGMIAFLMRYKKDSIDNIPFIAELFDQENAYPKKILECMRDCPGEDQMDRLIHRGGSTGMDLAAAGDGKRFESMKSIVTTNLKWIDADGMVGSLQRPDFSMYDLKGDQPVSVFICLPETSIDSHGAWLRMVVNCAVNAISKDRRKVRHPISGIIDEFGNLGYLPAVRRAFAIGAGQGLRLCVIVQSFAQLRANYAEIWEDFIANSALVVLSVNDNFTTAYLSERMGLTEKRDKKGEKGGEMVPTMTGAEIAEFTNVNRMNGIYLPNGEGPIFFDLIPYYKQGVAGEDFDQHPDHATAQDRFDRLRPAVRQLPRKEGSHAIPQQERRLIAKSA